LGGDFDETLKISINIRALLAHLGFVYVVGARHAVPARDNHGY
jgi:hypothetical protein